MGRQKKKKWPKDPDTAMKKVEEYLQEQLKDFVWKEISPRVKWKMQHRLNRMVKNIMFEMWQENMISVTMKPDQSMELNMKFPAWMVQCGEEKGDAEC